MLRKEDLPAAVEEIIANGPKTNASDAKAEWYEVVLAIYDLACTIRELIRKSTPVCSHDQELIHRCAVAMQRYVQQLPESLADIRAVAVTAHDVVFECTEQLSVQQSSLQP